MSGLRTQKTRMQAGAPDRIFGWFPTRRNRNEININLDYLLSSPLPSRLMIPMAYLSKLEGSRAIAVLLVVVSHLLLQSANSGEPAFYSCRTMARWGAIFSCTLPWFSWRRSNATAQPPWLYTRADSSEHSAATCGSCAPVPADETRRPFIWLGLAYIGSVLLAVPQPSGSLAPKLTPCVPCFLPGALAFALSG